MLNETFSVIFKHRAAGLAKQADICQLSLGNLIERTKKWKGNIVTHCKKGFLKKSLGTKTCFQCFQSWMLWKALHLIIAEPDALLWCLISSMLESSMSHDMSEKTVSWKKSARYSLHASPKNKREREATESWKPFMGLWGKIFSCILVANG